MEADEAAGDFKASMPPAYAAVFTPEDIAEHAGIVASRGVLPSRGVLWRSLPNGLAILCIVADDRPGLVALIGAGFEAHGIDVRSAQIYSRTRADQRVEAVDFFWVRGTTTGTWPDVNRFASCLRTINDFIRGSANPKRASAPKSQPSGAPVRIGFEPHAAIAGCWELSIEVPDRPGLLHAIARTLHQQGVQIVSSEIDTDGELAKDRFVLASSTDSELDTVRLSALEAALRRAVG